MEIDPEVLYRLVYERQWTPLLRTLYRHRKAVAGDTLLAHAAATFETAFFDELSGGPEGLDEALETLFLLHTGGFYRLPPARFEQVTEALVTLHIDHPEAAAGYARHCPDNPRCAAVLARRAPPAETSRVDAVTLTRHAPAGTPDAVTGLFKSAQEVDFFLAVREVFPTYFVYPNVALSAMIDYERLRDELTADERAYFFRALIDCVVFDQHDSYRPRFCFELDSALHDDAARQERDRRKERILALAGLPLHRIRKHDRTAGQAAFAALLRTLLESDT